MSSKTHFWCSQKWPSNKRFPHSATDVMRHCTLLIAHTAWHHVRSERLGVHVDIMLDSAIFISSITSCATISEKMQLSLTVLVFVNPVSIIVCTERGVIHTVL